MENEWKTMKVLTSEFGVTPMTVYKWLEQGLVERRVVEGSRNVEFRVAEGVKMDVKVSLSRQ